MDYVIFACIMVLFQTILNSSTVKCEEEKRKESFCPDNGRAHHGEWRFGTEEVGDYCELICHHGYNPSGCTILRKDGYGSWNYDIPTCEKESWFSISRYVCKVARFAPGFASGNVLSFMGFSKTGIVKKSFAATFMKWMKKVEKGSIFSKIQSAAMRGVYPTDIIELICRMITEYFSSKPSCETPRGKTEL